MSTDATEIVKAEEKPKPIIHANASGGLVLQTLDDVWRMATMVASSGLAPKGYERPETIVVAWEFGSELGLSRMQSLQSIAVINGRPTVWGDAVPGLVWQSGLCEDLQESIEGEGDKMVATCKAKRKGAETWTVATFSVDDARKAGLWGKSGPWTNYPKRMLKMRARAFCMRDAFADVLRGFQVREEVEDYEQLIQATAKTVSVDELA